MVIVNVYVPDPEDPLYSDRFDPELTEKFRKYLKRKGIEFNSLGLSIIYYTHVHRIYASASTITGRDLRELEKLGEIKEIRATYECFEDEEWDEECSTYVIVVIEANDELKQLLKTPIQLIAR